MFCVYGSLIMPKLMIRLFADWFATNL